MPSETQSLVLVQLIQNLERLILKPTHHPRLRPCVAPSGGQELLHRLIGAINSLEELATLEQTRTQL